MERYKEYKDSGVQWIGEIPSHWDCVQFRGLFNITKRIAGKTGYDVLAVTQKGIKVKDVESNEGQIASDYSKYQLVDPGDFAMNHMDLLTGFIGISPQTGVTSPDYRVFKNISSKANSKFYLFLFEMCYKQRIFYGLGHGVSNKGRWRLPAPIQNKFCIPLPPLAEQEKVVNYLESKTSKIDAYIAEKEKEVQLLNELKEAEIAKVVTQGLNPDVKMKNSGISWIGMIPEHWEMKRVRTFLSERKEKYEGDNSLSILSLLKGIGVIPYEEKGNVGNKAKEDLSTYKITRKGDVVVNCMNVIIGSSGITEYDGYISPAYYSFIPIDKELSILYKHWLSLPQMQGAIRCMAKGILEIRLRVSSQQLLSMKLPMPPKNEQIEILNYIDDKCNEINSLIDELEKEIDHLKEYKQRLIADCVTGQINVQNE